MIFLKENIRYLRKKMGLTQDGLAELLETRRSLIGSYEEGRGVPKLAMLKKMAGLFGVSIDCLLTENLEESGAQPPAAGHSLKILSIAVTPENDERISIVPVKAAAGYLNGRSDREYMEGLPHFAMPVPELSSGRTYRVFQIKGDSMLPIPPGSYLFCDYVEDAVSLKEGKTYVLITSDEGIVYKRVYHHSQHELMLKSDNPEYEPYMVETSSLLEIWRVLGYLSFDLPDQETIHVQKLSTALQKLEEEIQQLRKP